eukprot:1926514-Pleurochrysis_carterae.AAC.1
MRRGRMTPCPLSPPPGPFPHFPTRATGCIPRRSYAGRAMFRLRASRTGTRARDRDLRMRALRARARSRAYRCSDRSVATAVEAPPEDAHRDETAMGL